MAEKSSLTVRRELLRVLNRDSQPGTLSDLIADLSRRLAQDHNDT